MDSTEHDDDCDCEWCDEKYHPEELWADEPVGSCSRCGANIYRAEDDGSGLCDQCQWWDEISRETEDG